MFKERRVLAVIPARGGSKGIPLKNIQKINGQSLISRAGQVVREMGCVDRAVVSTDHDQIAQEAEKSGLSVPFRRPANLSGDLIGDYDVLMHVLSEVEKLDKVAYDIILMLQPTSPLRKVSHVMGAIQKLIDENRDSVWTVSRTDIRFHPLKQLDVSPEGNLDYFDQRGKKIIARQQLNPTFHCNGVVYVFTRDCLVNQKTKRGRNTGAMIIEEPTISIDTLEDLQYAASVDLKEGVK